MLLEIFRNSSAGLDAWAAFKKFQSGELVRSRSPLCIGPRGAMIHHGSRNFPKYVRGVCIMAAFKKNPKRGARSVSLPALHRPAGSNGPPWCPKFSETRAGRCIVAASTKNLKRGARSASLAAWTPTCVGQWSTMLFKSYCARVLGIFQFSASGLPR